MDDDIPYNFGCLPALPPGYSVVWHSCHVYYQGHLFAQGDEAA